MNAVWQSRCTHHQHQLNRYSTCGARLGALRNAVYQDEYRGYAAVLRQRWPAARFNMYIPNQQDAPFSTAVNGSWLDVVQDLQLRDCQGDASALSAGADVAELLTGAESRGDQDQLFEGPVGHYSDPRAYLNQNNVLAFQQVLWAADSGLCRVQCVDVSASVCLGVLTVCCTAGARSSV